MSEVSEKIERLSEEDLRGLHVAAIVSEAALALELLRLGFAEDDEEALEDAASLRPTLLAEIDRARAEAGEEKNDD